MGIEIGDILTLDMMVNTSDVIFAATAITPTVLMSGISNDLHSHSASTLLVNGNNRSMRLINNRYFK